MGRRWITIDTSRVALALARARLMGARYPYYLLADSAAGQRKEAKLSGAPPRKSRSAHFWYPLPTRRTTPLRFCRTYAASPRISGRVSMAVKKEPFGITALSPTFFTKRYQDCSQISSVRRSRLQPFLSSEKIHLRRASLLRHAEMKGLIIKEPWISLILSRRKTWELRSRDTRVRGRIALIRKGSGTVIGVADLVGTLPKLSRSKLISNVKKHQAPAREFRGDLKYTTAWVLRRAMRLNKPVAYRHPAGAVIWVNLSPEVVRRIERATWNSGSRTRSRTASRG